MKQLGLFHGSGGNGDVFWLPYLKNHFEAEGWEVINPDFPNSDKPLLAPWVSTAQESFVMNSETVLVGHSLGCPLIMSLLQRSDVKIDKAILVAGLYDNTRFDHPFLEEYDWEMIKKNCKQFVFIHSTNDPWDCDEQEADLAFGNLGGTKIIRENQGHFGSTTKKQEYPEFPLLIKLIED